MNVGLKAGQFVSWPASKGVAKGRVVSLHTGKVPGVVAAMTATAEKPAARVQLYAKSGSGWEPTGTHLAHPVSALSTISDLMPPTDAEQQATEAVVAGSFDDIRATVQDAISDRIEALAGLSPTVYVCDIGFTWAVYMVDYGDDLWMIDYTIDAAGVVTLGDPVEVLKVTSYVPDVDPVDGPTGDVLTESVTVEGRLLAAGGVDSAGGRIFRMQLIKYGDSKNGRRYTEAVIRPAAAKYDGAKAFDHHRPMSEINTSTVSGLVGTYRNVEATSTGLEADLHLLPSATHIAEALDLSLANQAQGLPPLVGVSHDVLANWKRVTVNGRQLVEAVSIESVNSVDVVADPSAGGMPMRMVAGGPGDPNPPNSKENPVFTKQQLLALFRATEAAERPALFAQFAQQITDAGSTPNEFARELEGVAAPTAAGAPSRATEAARYVKDDLSVDALIDAAMGRSGLNGVRAREAVVADLGDEFTQDDLKASVARVKRMTESLGATPTVPDNGSSPRVSIRFDSVDKKKAALDAFFQQKWTEGYVSLRQAWEDFTDYRGDRYTEDVNRRILQESAIVGGQLWDSQRATESVTTSTWGSILGDSVTRTMVSEYNRMDFMVWQNLVQTVPVFDFRTRRVDRLGDYANLPTVNQGAPYNPLTTPSNEEATWSPTKKGGTEDLTLETIANDDVNIISRLPRRLAIAAGQTMYKFVMDFFIAPITATYDSTATFAAGHNNTDTNALNDTNLSAGWAKMLKQSALSGTSNFLPVNPQYLLVPPDLRQMGLVLCESAVAVPSGIAGASNIPNVNKGLIPIIVPYWTGTSTTAWFLVADPSMTPGIQIGFYNGRVDPELFVQADQTVGSMFDADKVTYKIRHTYGGTVVDHRGLYRGNT